VVVAFAGMGAHSADGGGARCSVVPDPGRERPDKGGPRNPEVVTLSATAVPIIVLDHGIPSRVAIKVIKGTASTYKVTERLAAAGSLDVASRPSTQRSPSVARSALTLSIVTTPSRLGLNRCGSVCEG
jgi:hypothetical protein